MNEEQTKNYINDFIKEIKYILQINNRQTTYDCYNIQNYDVGGYIQNFQDDNGFNYDQSQ